MRLRIPPKQKNQTKHNHKKTYKDTPMKGAIDFSANLVCLKGQKTKIQLTLSLTTHRLKAK
jgi:hypothetical protein